MVTIGVNNGGHPLAVAEELEQMRRGEAIRVVRDGYGKILTHTSFPREHRRRIRANNFIERPKCEIRRRTCMVGTFPDGKSALKPVTEKPKYAAEGEWAPQLPGHDAVGRASAPDSGPIGLSENTQVS